jgi:hypothetical protein
MCISNTPIFASSCIGILSLPTDYLREDFLLSATKAGSSATSPLKTLTQKVLNVKGEIPTSFHGFEAKIADFDMSGFRVYKSESSGRLCARHFVGVSLMHIRKAWLLCRFRF